MAESDLFDLVRSMRCQLWAASLFQVTFVVLLVAALMVLREIDKKQLVDAIGAAKCDCKMRHKGGNSDMQETLKWPISISGHQRN